MGMNEFTMLAAILGCLANSLLIFGLIWSIFRPEQRVWPPEQSTAMHRIAVWTVTCIGFGSAIFIGFSEWGILDTPAVLRWGLGSLLIILGNAVVWAGVFDLGLAVTSGAEGSLRTTGLYRYSRNPQYLADIAILAGIGILSASMMSWPVIVTGIAALALAPFSEEPWLMDKYGAAYAEYLKVTPRFL
jgi:protein-S-isoprenylcysteine O-methyltransferase Ste14